MTPWILGKDVKGHVIDPPPTKGTENSEAVAVLEKAIVCDKPT